MSVSRISWLEAAAVPSGEQPKYFMLNLVYAAGVIETPSRITRALEGDTRDAPLPPPPYALPLRSEAKHNICRLIYHSAHLTPSSPAIVSVSLLAPRLVRVYCFSFRNLRLASFKQPRRVSTTDQPAKI